MGVRSESQGAMAADPQAVYDYLADASRWPEWARAILECHVSGGGPMRTGARLDQRARGRFGSSRPRTLDVIAAEAPRRLAFAGMMGSWPMQWGFDLSPRAGGTGVTLWLDAELRGLMRLVIGGMLPRMVGQVNMRELAAIRTAVERPA